MAEEKKESFLSNWEHILQSVVLVAAGGACLFYGQTEAGTALITLGVSSFMPKKAATQVVQVVAKLPPFYKKGPGSP